MLDTPRLDGSSFGEDRLEDIHSVRNVTIELQGFEFTSYLGSLFLT